MAENFNISSLVIPGTYIRVRAEALIRAGGISTGNIGIVGTASQGLDETHTLSNVSEAFDALGNYDAISARTLNLVRGIELLYRNGARTVFARGLAAGANQTDFTNAFDELVKEEVNLLVAPELATETAITVLQDVLERAENGGQDAIAVIGSDAADVANIRDQAPTNDRIILTTPGFLSFDRFETNPETGRPGREVTLDGRYSAAAVAGLLSTLAPQSSPTNKTVAGIVRLAQKFSYGEKEQLVGGRVLALEERGGGVRVLRGLTTDDGAFRQITTRRITDFAKAGIRRVADPFIGKLNNTRVRAALKGAIDGFLASLVQDEALIAYELEVTATRDDEIQGRALVNATLQPTFSIDFIAVTMYLE